MEFRHNGLKRFADDDDPRRLPPEMVKRIGCILHNSTLQVVHTTWICPAHTYIL